MFFFKSMGPVCIFFYVFCLCSTTFRNVFRALARAQTVGVSVSWILLFFVFMVNSVLYVMQASVYRTRGRYARPPEKPLSADHQAMKDIGAIEVSKIS